MSAIQQVGAPSHLHRIKRVKNHHYVRDGKKSYAHALRKYNIKPTVEGPFDMIDVVHHPEDQHVLRRLQNRVQGRPTHVTHRRLVTKDASGQVGEVSAQDVQNDTEYLCQIGIGSPPQQMNMDFDTGSADLLPDSVEIQGKRSGHNIFNSAISHTWNPIAGSKWNITYGDGSSAGGNVGKDTVDLGGIQVHNQAVEIATRLSEQFAQNQGDGLVGLAFDSINTVTPGPVHTPVQNMISQSAIPANCELFTAHLGSVHDVNDPDHGASFYTFGVIDQKTLAANKATTSDIHYTPVDNSNGFWQIASNAYSVNGKQHNTSGESAIMDTGTTLCLVDDQICKNIYSAIPGSRLDSSQGGYVFPASTPLSSLPVVQLAIGNRMFQVSKESLGFASIGNGYVFGGIQSRGDMPFSIFGDVVLTNLYAIFDVSNLQFGCIQRYDPTNTTSDLEKCAACGTACPSCAKGD